MAAGDGEGEAEICVPRSWRALRQSRQAGRGGIIIIVISALSKTCRQSWSIHIHDGGTFGRAHSQLPSSSQQSQQPGRGRATRQRRRCQVGRSTTIHCNDLIMPATGPRATASSTNRDAAYQGAQPFLAPDFPCNRRPLRHRTLHQLPPSSLSLPFPSCSSFRIPTWHRDLRPFFSFSWGVHCSTKSTVTTNLPFGA